MNRERLKRRVPPSTARKAAVVLFPRVCPFAGSSSLTDC
jgi:hypothetical protein